MAFYCGEGGGGATAGHAPWCSCTVGRPSATTRVERAAGGGRPAAVDRPSGLDAYIAH
jgi:hypothetical protein